MAAASSGARAGRIRTSRGRASGLSGVEEKNRRTRKVVGPTTSRVFTICSRTPATIDAIAMTVAITTPPADAVAPDRLRFGRSWSRATPHRSLIEYSRRPLTAQRPDDVEQRNRVPTVDTQDHFHAHTQEDRHGARPAAHTRSQGGE